MTSQHSQSISRADLLAIVAAACEGITESTRAKLMEVAASTDAVAVGWFHCDGTQCPASQAGRRNQRFQEAFDRAMADRFGVDLPEADGIYGPAFEPFVVEVRA